MVKIFFSQHHVTRVTEADAHALEQAGLILDDEHGGYYPASGVTVDEVEAFIDGI